VRDFFLRCHHTIKPQIETVGGVEYQKVGGFCFLIMIGFLPLTEGFVNKMLKYFFLQWKRTYKIMNLTDLTSFPEHDNILVET
jgi:hypothetical protein